ncbi:hypothetical protein [Cetobacterium sp.]|uniref:hypothetical protein n=1 Tax=Cetobacterium sp. TaxID=2071632 RepID=UPI003F3DD2FA
MGIKEWNRNSDQMPIKTMNNNGLQVLEEVPGEYKIYIDKDAVMTTVAKYAPGSYQTFMERKADVDNSRSLLKGYKIEWTQQDDSDLFIQCNNEAISKIENQPMTLDEPTQPVVLGPKTVPTTYECCFRVGNDGVYVGEGYENLCSNIGSLTLGHMVGTNLNIYDNVDSQTFTGNASASIIINVLLKNAINIGEKYYIYSRIVNRSKYSITLTFNALTVTGNSILPNEDKAFRVVFEAFANSSLNYQVRGNNVAGDEFYFDIYKDKMIVKSDASKPFVKSVMPSGKLDRITNANETTHTFLNKGDGVVTFGNGYFSLKSEKIQQLLVYNALLTEQEKRAELAKDIKLR